MPRRPALPRRLRLMCCVGGWHGMSDRLASSRYSSGDRTPSRGMPSDMRRCPAKLPAALAAAHPAATALAVTAAAAVAAAVHTTAAALAATAVAAALATVARTSIIAATAARTCTCTPSPISASAISASHTSAITTPHTDATSPPPAPSLHSAGTTRRGLPPSSPLDLYHTRGERGRLQQQRIHEPALACIRWGSSKRRAHCSAERPPPAAADDWGRRKRVDDHVRCDGRRCGNGNAHRDVAHSYGRPPRRPLSD